MVCQHTRSAHPRAGVRIPTRSRKCRSSYLRRARPPSCRPPRRTWERPGPPRPQCADWSGDHVCWEGAARVGPIDPKGLIMMRRSEFKGLADPVGERAGKPCLPFLADANLGRRHESIPSALISHSDSRRSGARGGSHTPRSRWLAAGYRVFPSASTNSSKTSAPPSAAQTDARRSSKGSDDPSCEAASPLPESTA